MPKRIAFLGPAGTFTEEAALQYAPGADFQAFPSIPAVALAVQTGSAQEGIVPIENSLEGSVTDTLDILINERIFINRELVLPIEHCLLFQPGVKASDIKIIYSHPQALAQCRRFLERCFPTADLIASFSTAAAVLDAKESSSTAAAIAPKRTSELYNVEVFAEGIQDNNANATRFVVLADTDHPPTGQDKTSFCLSFHEDRPGLLYSTMGEFAIRNINLVKIESRPTKQSLGQYIFLIDCEGHRKTSPLKETIETLQPKTSMLKIFGSYPSWEAI